MLVKWIHKHRLMEEGELSGYEGRACWYHGAVLQNMPCGTLTVRRRLIICSMNPHRWLIHMGAKTDHHERESSGPPSFTKIRDANTAFSNHEVLRHPTRYTIP